MKQYLFIVGREPELSVAELEAKFLPHGQVELLNAEVVLVKTTKELPATFIDQLGGSLKMGEVLEQCPRAATVTETVGAWLTPEKLVELLPENGRDIGFSVYGGASREPDRFKPFGMELKSQVRKLGRTLRLVTSREPQLSAVTVQRQGLVTHGIEFLIVVTPTDIVIGRTLSVQDYQGYSLRDYGRPEADAKRGMIPPKLAQMMLNLSHVTADDVVLDPFCGVGTILQEAALLGVREIHGSDFDGPAVKAAQANIRWLLKEKPDLNVTVDIVRRDAREMAVRATVIVTEPDLGIPLRGHEPLSFLEKEARRLEKLYSEVFTTWSHWILEGGRIAMVWPVFQGQGESIGLDLERHVSALGFELQPLLSPETARILQVDNPRVLEYARQTAKVRRQVRVWRRAGK